MQIVLKIGMVTLDDEIIYHPLYLYACLLHYRNHLKQSSNFSRVDCLVFFVQAAKISSQSVNFDS